MPGRRLAEIIELQYVYLFKTEKWFVDEPVLGNSGLAWVSLPTLKLFSAGLMALIGSLFFL